MNEFKQAEHKGRDQLLLCLNGLTLSVYEGVCVGWGGVGWRRDDMRDEVIVLCEHA